jgi:hypothetical protein
MNTTNSSLPTSSRPRARTREWSSSPCPWRTPTCKTNGSATSCACASGCHASRLSRTGSATAADTAGPGTVTGWRGPARATAETCDRAPARPLLQEAMEEGVLPTQLGPQCPGRVAQPRAGRPSLPGTDGHDSANPGRPTARRHQGDEEWDLLDPGRGHNLPGLTTPRQPGR